MSTSNVEKDALTGTETTGHEWDGIRELNTPLPKWWVYLFWATIIWSIGYWIAMPAWPLGTTSTPGILHYNSRIAVEKEEAAAQAAMKPMLDRIQKASLQEIQSNRDLLNFALTGGRIAFADNCAACHGTGATGGHGFPNLTDDDWLYGGTLSDILTTITHGIRSYKDPNTRDQGLTMPAWAQNGLNAEQINDVADYVLSLSGSLTTPDDAAVAKGKQIFADNCAACHGADAKGNQQMGAPNLTDKIWLYGGDKKTVVETITNGRGGVMPAWGDRLDPATIKMLAVYVHSLGGGQ